MYATAYSINFSSVDSAAFVRCCITQPVAELTPSTRRIYAKVTIWDVPSAAI